MSVAGSPTQPRGGCQHRIEKMPLPLKIAAKNRVHAFSQRGPPSSSEGSENRHRLTALFSLDDVRYPSPGAARKAPKSIYSPSTQMEIPERHGTHPVLHENGWFPFGVMPGEWQRRGRKPCRLPQSHGETLSSCSHIKTVGGSFNRCVIHYPKAEISYHDGRSVLQEYVLSPLLK